LDAEGFSTELYRNGSVYSSDILETTDNISHITVYKVVGMEHSTSFTPLHHLTIIS